MLFQALFLVAITTIADFIGAGVVVWKLYRPSYVRLVINFAVGTLLAVSIADLLPEALELTKGSESIFLMVLAGTIFAFLFERFLAWYHCHDEKCEAHPASPGKKITLLAGSSLEEFIDGAAVGLAVMAGVASQNPTLAFVMTLTVFVHELPETASKVVTLTTFGITPSKSMQLILATALAGFVGAAVAVFLSQTLTAALPFLLALVAGIFLYIATADLIPKLHHTLHRAWFLWEIIAMIAGIFIILLLGRIG